MTADSALLGNGFSSHCWALGTYHGVRAPHLRRYLEEFTFRWNRNRLIKLSFDMLLSISTHLPHAGYGEFVRQMV